MGYGATIGKDNRDYEGEQDARTLLDAHTIMSDGKRMKRATVHIDKSHAAHTMLAKHMAEAAKESKGATTNGIKDNKSADSKTAKATDRPEDKVDGEDY